MRNLHLILSLDIKVGGRFFIKSMQIAGKPFPQFLKSFLALFRDSEIFEPIIYHLTDLTRKRLWERVNDLILFFLMFIFIYLSNFTIYLVKKNV